MSKFFEAALVKVRKEITRHQAEINNLAKIKDQRTEADEQALSISVYKALSFVDNLIEGLRALDRSIILCNNHWWPTRAVLVYRGKWKSVEDRVQEGKESLLHCTQTTRDVWAETSALTDDALEHAMTLSVEASKLHGSHAKLEHELNGIQKLLLASISKVQSSLDVVEKKRLEAEANLSLKQKELMCLNIDERWADLGSGIWQTFWGGVADGAAKSTAQAAERNTSAFASKILEGMARGIEEGSKRNQANRAETTKIQRDELQKSLTEINTQKEDLQKELHKLQKDESSQRELILQFNSSQIEVSNIMTAIRNLELELVSRKAQAAQTMIRIQHILAYWDMVLYSECREEILEVTGHVIRASEEQMLEGNTSSGSTEIVTMINAKMRSLLDKIKEVSEDMKSMTPAVEAILAKVDGPEQRSKREVWDPVPRN